MSDTVESILDQYDWVNKGEHPHSYHWQSANFKSYAPADAPSFDQTTDRESLNFLHALISGMGARTVVETGTNIGVGTVVMADAMCHGRIRSNWHKLRLVTTEPVDETRQRAALTIASAATGNTLYAQSVADGHSIISLLPDTSGDVDYGEVLGTHNAVVDLVFIDCWDRLNALANVLPWVRDEGLIVIHDWLDRVSRANFMIEEWMRPYLSEPICILNSRGIGLYQVRKPGRYR